MKKVIALSTVLALGALGFGCDSGAPANNANTGNTAKPSPAATTPAATPAASPAGNSTTPNSNAKPMDNTNAKPMDNTNAKPADKK